MRILSRYLLTRFLMWLATIILVLCAGVVVAELLVNLDDLTAVGGDFSGALRILGLKVLAYYLPLLIPIACFAATFLTFGLAARWLEVTAMKAGGISPLRAVVPVLLAAALLSVITLVLNETVVIDAERAWRQGGSDQAGKIEFRRGSFWYHRGRFIYNVHNADPATRTLEGVRVFEMTPEGRLVRRLDARTARVDQRGWRLEDVTERRFDLEHPARPPELSHHAETLLEGSDTSDPTLLEADAATLSLPNLWELIAARTRDGEDVTRFRALLHDRLSDPLTVLLLALLAVPFALRTERTHSLAVPSLQASVLILVFWSVRSAATVYAPSGPDAALLLPWCTLLAFATWGLWRCARVPR